MRTVNPAGNTRKAAAPGLGSTTLSVATQVSHI